MAGFEVVFRPVVMPNIRPSPAQSLPPADDPEKGFCTITGNPATQVDFSVSWSRSTSKSHQVETQRRVDESRVYQMADDGSVNRDNFVDMQSANRIKTRGGSKPDLGQYYDSAQGFLPVPGGVLHPTTVTHYQRQPEEPNIEIKKTDEIIDNPEAGV
jgi:hypothetical protein